MTEAKKQYSVRLGQTEKDQQIVLNLWSAGFDHIEEISGRYEWLYLSNPAGPGLVYFLDHAGENNIVGAVSLAPRRWKVAGQYIDAGIMADLVVDSQHRSLGPAIKLHNNSIDLGLEHFDLVYGFPNPRSAVLAKFAKFQMTSQTTRYAKPLRYYKYLQKKMPEIAAKLVAVVLDNTAALWGAVCSISPRMRWRFGVLDGFDNRFDELWGSAELNNYIIGQRDARFLKWRFSQSAAHFFQVFAITKKADNTLGGYVVYSVSDSGTVTIADFLAYDFDKTLSDLFILFGHKMRSMGYKSLSLNFHGSQELTDALRSAGFKTRESTPFSCKWTERFSQLKEGSHWFVTAADNDI